MIRKTRQFIRILALLLLWPMAQPAMAAGADGDAWTLEDCIAYALTHHMNIQVAKFDQYIAEKQVQEYRGIGLPQVSGSGNFQQYGDFPVTLIDIKSFPSSPGTPALPSTIPDSLRYATARFGVKYNASLGAQITQLIFDGSFFVGLKAAESVVELSEINVQRTEIETAVAVSKAYYNAIVFEERAKTFDVNLEKLEQLLETTEAMFKEGFVEKLDVDRLRINYNNLKIEKNKADRMVSIGYDMLKFQMGMPVDEDLMLADKIEDLDRVPELETISETGDFSMNRIEMNMLDRQIQLQELNIRRNQVGLFGTLAGFANFNYQTYRPRFFEINIDKKWFQSNFMGLSYSVTLFDGFQKSARIQQSRYEIEKIRANQEMFRQSVMLETNNAVNGLMNAWDDVTIARENLELAEEIHRISVTKYKEGVGSNLELIDAQSTLMQSKVNYLSAVYNYSLAQIELKRVKGEIRPQEILEKYPTE